ncbi:DUF2778 domain-containing protein, partial [Escherichia coli]|nr:DUF2778 domain-containing protein [Escherichia coli]
MTWEYKVSTGVLSHNGEFVANCYSGAGESKDKPECESQRNRGPIPRGIYFIAGWNNHKSAEAIILEPIAGTNTFGRDHFQIHGDKKGQPPGSASAGCIIMNGQDKRH